MSKRDRTDATDCFRGLECHKINCPFSHPYGFIRKIINCRDGLKCAVSNCSCVHPANWEWRNNINCKLMNNCANHDCTYKHPDGWSWRANVPCKFTINCMAHKSGLCKFKHDVIAADEEALANLMGALAVSIDCKYGIACFTKDCFYKHPDGWDHRKNTVCKFGFTCKKKDLTCMFKHVKGEKPAKLKPKVMEIEGEKPKIISNDKKEKKKEKENKIILDGMVVDDKIGEKFKLAIHRKKAPVEKLENAEMVV